MGEPLESWKRSRDRQIVSGCPPKRAHPLQLRALMRSRDSIRADCFACQLESRSWKKKFEKNLSQTFALHPAKMSWSTKRRLKVWFLSLNYRVCYRSLIFALFFNLVCFEQLFFCKRFLSYLLSYRLSYSLKLFRLSYSVKSVKLFS